MKTRFIALFLLLCTILTLPALAIPESGEDRLALLKMIDEDIRDYYLFSDGILHLPADLKAEDLEDDDTFWEQVRALEEPFDKYSGFYSKEQYEEYYPKSMAYVGVGIVLDTLPQYGLVVDRTLEEGSAFEEGILPGDMIVEVDGLDIRDLSWLESSDYLRGESGTEVTVKVLRHGEKDYLEFTLTRRGIYIPSVAHYVEGDTAVVSISLFGSYFDYVMFCDIYDEIAEAGVKKVIFDLRDNPGGDVNVIWNILSYIVEGEVPIFSFKSYETEEEFITTGTNTWKPEKMFVLINEYSTSAAEIFAGVLRDLDYAVLIGETTYGKSRAQGHITYDDGSVLVITTAAVELSVTGDYEEKGISPDIETPLVPSGYEKPEDWMELSDLTVTTGLFKSQWHFAIQQRMKVLGYYNGEPNGEYDFYMNQCVMAFQKAYGLTLTDGYITYAVVVKLNELMELLETVEFYYEDQQMIKALELSKGK